MKLKLITVTLDPETGEFPEDPLEGVHGEVLSVVEHFFHHGGLPKLLLVVHHREQLRAGSEKRRRKEKNPADALSGQDRKLFEKLRAWRRGRAEADGVPAYVILTNRGLAKLAEKRPNTVNALQEVEGVGTAKVDRYGRQILRLIAEERAGDAENDQAGSPTVLQKPVSRGSKEVDRDAP